MCQWNENSRRREFELNEMERLECLYVCWECGKTVRKPSRRCKKHIYIYLIVKCACVRVCVLF